MKALAIIGLVVLAFWFISVQWGILAFVCGLGAAGLVATDKDGRAGEQLMAGLFFISICGGAVAICQKILGS